MIAKWFHGDMKTNCPLSQNELEQIWWWTKLFKSIKITLKNQMRACSVSQTEWHREKRSSRFERTFDSIGSSYEQTAQCMDCLRVYLVHNKRFCPLERCDFFFGNVNKRCDVAEKHYCLEFCCSLPSDY